VLHNELQVITHEKEQEAFLQQMKEKKLKSKNFQN
jgi:hypothetical protein